MAGLQKILKMYGQMNVGGVLWVWDYATDQARIKSEMTRKELADSERAKIQGVLDAAKEQVGSIIRSSLPKNNRKTGHGFESF